MFRIIASFSLGVSHGAIALLFSVVSLWTVAQPAALDSSFNAGGVVSSVSSFVQQPDGKIIVTGGFPQSNGTDMGIARLQPDGSLDSGFDPGAGAFAVMCSALLPNGKILVGGSFTSFDSTEMERLARLHADGSLDAGFDPGTGADGTIYCIVPQPDGKLLIGGDFEFYDGTARAHIARLDANGALDPSFDPGAGTNEWVRAIALQPDGKILIGGDFTSYDGTARNGIARLDPDGALDPTFDPGSGADDPVMAITLQPDAKILIGGWFYLFNGENHHFVARLEADGSLDPGFSTGMGPDNGIRSVTLQPNGKVIVGGWYIHFDGLDRFHITRLHADGSVDMGFDPGSGTNGPVFGTALQPDGKILVAGNFSNYQGAFNPGIIRLNGDGTTGVEGRDPMARAWTLYPNPATDYLCITGPHPVPVQQVSVRGLSGKQIYALTPSEMRGGWLLLNIKTLIPGMYLLEIQGDGPVERLRFVKWR